MLLVFANFACTKKNSSESSAAATSADTGGKLVYTEQGARCPNGEPAGYLRGTCGGRWSYVPVVGAVKTPQCSYEWGPAVSCPAGTKAVGYEAVCYGVTSKEVTDRNAVTSAEQCAQAFGAAPSNAQYELVCCPQAAMVAPAKHVPAGTGG